MCSVVARMVYAQSSNRPAKPPSAKTNRTRVRRRVSNSMVVEPLREPKPV
jgi:hypothetical protein